ncbi:MAG: hypothetical protein ACOCW5_04500 [Spirochaetia bacterium]
MKRARRSDDPQKADRTLSAGLERFQIDESGLFRPYAEAPVYPDQEESRAPSAT